MEKLSFDNGMRTYEVNDTTTVSFNPTSMSFADSCNKILTKFDEICKRNQAIENADDAYEAYKESDSEMRSEIDAVFGENASSGIFGEAHLFDIVESTQLPLVINFMMAVLDIVDKSVDDIQKPNPKVDAYIKKYQKKYGVK